MDITPSTIYWITRLDNVRLIINLLTILFAFLFAILFAIGLDRATVEKHYTYHTDEYINSTRSLGDKIVCMSLAPFVVWLILFIVNAFIPTTKEAAAMYVIPAIVNNEKVQTVGNRLYDLAIEWMDEFKPTKKEETK